MSSQFLDAIEEIRKSYRRASATISRLDENDPKQAERQRQILLILSDRIGEALRDIDDSFIESLKEMLSNTDTD